MASPARPTLTITHRQPPGGSDRMPCCGRSPFEVPSWHRLTDDPEQVSCPGKEAT
jgi:hypothetical protein